MSVLGYRQSTLMGLQRKISSAVMKKSPGALRSVVRLERIRAALPVTPFSIKARRPFTDDSKAFPKDSAYNYSNNKHIYIYTVG